MSDNVADEIIQSGYRRWLLIEEAKEAASEDAKELMAELKSAGLDPKITRAAFRREREAQDAQKVAENEETEMMIELYRAALARVAHVRAA
ncbi:DUF2312 domain-containing protein [Devosia sp. A8/3-2]|nr:DUF2312 domain-containing protein [Devosia sp. A8/3-2]